MSERKTQQKIRNFQYSKWDKENMSSLSCRVRSYEALLFKEYCEDNGTTPYKVLKDCVLNCIEEYTQSKKR